MRKKTLSILLVLTCLFSLLHLNLPLQADASSGFSRMTDESFFGKYSNGAWTIQGKLNYELSGLSTVKAKVMAGDYTQARDALLAYYRAKQYPALGTVDRQTKQVPIYLDKIFTIGSERYIGSMNLTTAWQSHTLNITSDLDEQFVRSGAITFIALARNKGTDEGQFYSKEAATVADRPILKITKNDSTVVSVNPSKDTYVDGMSFDSNFGSGSTLKVRDVGDPRDKQVKKSYLTFNFTVPWNEVSKVELILKGHHTGASGTKEIIFYRSGETGWTESTYNYRLHSGKTFSYNDLPGGCSWNLPETAHGADHEYHFQVPRFGFAFPIISEYHATQNETYAEGMIDIMLDVIKDRADIRSYPRSLDTTGRLAAFIYGVRVMRNSTHMTSSALLDILKSIHEMGAFLHGDFGGSYYHPGSNWGIWESNSLLNASIDMPEFKDSSTWVATAKTRLSSLISNLVFDDGVYNESTSSYSFAIGATYLGMIKKASDNGTPFEAQFSQRIHKLGTYLSNLVYPDVTDINWGDSGAADQSAVLKQYADVYNDEAIRYVATKGQQGTAPTYKSILFASHNMGIQRSGWTTNDKMLMMQASTCNTHKHPDDLSVILYGYGKPLLVDSGAFTYANETISNYLRGTTKAHNTIEVDGQNQVRGEVSANSFYTSDKVDFMSMTTKSTSAVKHTRNVFFVRPDFYVVQDYLKPNNTSNHTYRANWHTAPHLTVSVGSDSKSIETTSSNNPTIKIQSADAVTTTTESGYYSSAFYSSQESTYGRFTKTGSGPTTLNTLLLPRAAGATTTATYENVTIPNVTQNQASASKVTKDNTDYYFYVSNDGSSDSRQVSDYAVKGKAAYIGKPSSQTYPTTLYLNQGTEIKKGSEILLQSPYECADVAVGYNGNTMTIEGETLIANTSTTHAVKIYAPTSVTQVTLNGQTVPFTREGNYIYAAVATDLLAHWEYENNGNNSGRSEEVATLNGNASYVTDAQVGEYAVSLDGDGDHISSNLITNKTDNITFSMWVKPSSLSSDIDILFHNGHTASSGYGLANYNNKLTLLIAGKKWCTSNAALQTNKWQHLVGVRRNGTWEVYLNGTAVTLSDNQTAPNTPSGNTMVGGNITGPEDFSGIVDDVRIYEKALTTEKIQELYNSSKNPLVAHWQYENNGNNSGEGDQAATLNGNAAYVTDAKVGSYAVALDGNGDYISSDVVSTSIDNVSFSMWVKPASLSGTKILFHNGNTSSSGYGLIYYNNKVTLLVGGKGFCVSGASLTTNQWQHLVGIRREGVWELYVNGSKATINNTNLVPATPNGKTTVGSNTTGGEAFHGNVDEVRVYDKALTTEEVTALSQP